MKIGCIVMAAGSSMRFGSNKLLFQVDGQSMIDRALSIIPTEQLYGVTVVTQYEEVVALAHRYGFHCVRNHHPEWGISHTISLGIGSMPWADAAIFLVADQPMLTKSSVSTLISTYLAHSDQIVALSHSGKRGNPCLFPAEFFPELLALQGDVGGSMVIRAHPDRLLLVETGSAELQDIDTTHQLP